MAGCLLAALTYFPIFQGLTHYANPAIEAASTTNPVVVVADPATCSFQFDPVGKKVFSNSCDIVKSALAKSGVPYANEAAPAGTVASVKIGGNVDRLVRRWRRSMPQRSRRSPTRSASS